MLKLSAWLAIAVGVAIDLAEVVRNRDNLALWPTWSIDIVAGAALVAGGIWALRRGAGRLLTPAWSFAAGVYCSAFAAHALVVSRFEGDIRQRAMALTVITGVLFALSLAGAVTSMASRKAAA